MNLISLGALVKESDILMVDLAIQDLTYSQIGGLC